MENYKIAIINKFEIAKNIGYEETFYRKFDSWIEQVKSEVITDVELVLWLQNQYYYWSAKDREYGSFLEKFLNKSGFGLE